jgi:hypothetical protein
MVREPRFEDQIFLGKNNIMQRWKETSSSKALFLWAVKKDEHGRDGHRQLQDKLAQS